MANTFQEIIKAYHDAEWQTSRGHNTFITMALVCFDSKAKKPLYPSVMNCPFTEWRNDHGLNEDLVEPGSIVAFRVRKLGGTKTLYFCTATTIERFLDRMNHECTGYLRVMFKCGVERTEFSVLLGNHS